MKEEAAFVKFGPLITLHKKNGVEINPTYNNDKRCAEMIGQIADTIKESLAAKLRAAHYLAILIDGDSDISNTECEIVYVRLLENGKPINLLVRQQTLEHSHALGVLNATIAAFDAVCPGDDGGWMRKFVSFGADGASVNMGTRGGVIAHWQSEAGSHIIQSTVCHTDTDTYLGNVCFLHRLELTILTLQKKEPKVLYDRSLLSDKNLGVDICSPSSVRGTRWIPHIHRAMKVFLQHGQDKDLDTMINTQWFFKIWSIWQHQRPLLLKFKDGQKWKWRVHFSVYFATFLFPDLFEELATLSLTLQRNNLILPQATSELKKTVTRLEALKIKPKPGGLLEKIQSSFAQQQGDEMSFQGNDTGLTHPQLKQHVEAAFSISVDAIKARFGGLVKDEGIQTILDSFRMLNPNTWPEEQANLLTFGEV
ncbi:Zinc finger protein 862 [Merluccius polli]|uniref:Zinc finger protein 862 n=1 Tax=Merluccius polli TaxID=89951 RepID=A0AA47M8K4_MERPO|nr:Zinc finger protein 862 [Merluccius polli]